MQKVKDITGQRFGRLTVIRRSGTCNGRNATWLCVCDCGKERVVKGTSLRSGHTVSCGCFHSQLMAEKMTTHTQSRSRLYGVWNSMRSRCYRPADKHFHHYGGRGITVCNEWLNNFQAFYDWAMSNGYDENAPRGQCTIDRIDNDKGYSPDNCRWITIQEQQFNKRTRRKSL